MCRNMPTTTTVNLTHQTSIQKLSQLPTILPGSACATPLLLSSSLFSAAALQDNSIPDLDLDLAELAQRASSRNGSNTRSGKVYSDMGNVFQFPGELTLPLPLLPDIEEPLQMHTTPYSFPPVHRQQTHRQPAQSVASACTPTSSAGKRRTCTRSRSPSNLTQAVLNVLMPTHGTKREKKNEMLNAATEGMCPVQAKAEKNRLSAQNHRRRKKEYVRNLEEVVAELAQREREHLGQIKALQAALQLRVVCH